jgi:RNA polymerase sigma factor (sigma-70 family)
MKPAITWRPEQTLRPMSAEMELELVRRVASKDRQAFEELYKLYYRRLFGFLLRFTRRTDVVEEILNDAMFVVWQKAAGFQERSRVSTWVFGIAYRKALKRLERLRRLPQEISPEQAGLHEQGGPDRNVELRELQDTLQAALARLSPEQRVVIELTYNHGYSVREIAGIVDCPVNTVKTRMFHARRRLREMVPRLSPGLAASRGEGAQ